MVETSRPSDRHAEIAGNECPNVDPLEQYERSFRRNRDDAIENGYDLCCPICGCAYYDAADDWDALHEGSLHRLYEVITKESS